MHMKTPILYDTLGRRRRDIPVSTGDKPAFHSVDLRDLEKIQRHGPLPLSYLSEYRKPEFTNHKRAGHRFTQLFHSGYVARPIQQKATDFSFWNEKVYDLTEKSVEVLKDNDRWHENVPERSNSWLHNFMQACVTASIELSTLQQPDKYRYIFHDEIVDRYGPPEYTFTYFDEDEKPVERTLKPDVLGGIEYLELDAAFYFPVEIDAGTEQNYETELTRARKALSPEQKERKTHQTNIRQYMQFIGGGEYKKYFGEKSAMLALNVFNKPRKMQNVINLAVEVSGGKGMNYLLYQSLDDFLPLLFKPGPFHPELFYEAWSRPGRSSYNISTL